MMDRPFDRKMFPIEAGFGKVFAMPDGILIDGTYLIPGRAVVPIRLP